MKDTVTTAVFAKSNNLTLEIAKRDIQHVNIVEDNIWQR